jgi:U4/U6.U5 tri-snRNP component SNU23
MRVERADTDKVKARMEALKQSMSNKSKEVKLTALESHNKKIAVTIAEEQDKKQKKKEVKNLPVIEVDKNSESFDPEMAEMMGFSGFGSSRK